MSQCNDTTLRIDNILDHQSQELADSIRRALKSIVDCIIYCGKQGISFRGHRDDATTDASSNRGNFIALLEFRANTDSVLANFIEKAPKNARSTSKTIQNELIDVCGDYMHQRTYMFDIKQR